MATTLRAAFLDRFRTRTWVGYAASVWMFVFAAMSCYWALGGTVGVRTVSPGIRELVHTPWFSAVLWLTMGMKVAGGLLALALVRPWGLWLPRRLLLLAAWGVSGLLVLHGGDLVIQGALTDSGLIGLDPPDAWTTDHWQTLVWGPWWVLGGILFCVATWTYQRRSVATCDSG